MTASLHKRPLRLTLHPNDVLPEAMSWRVVEGYVRSLTWDWEGESITLGLWGPGDVISSEDPPFSPWNSIASPQWWSTTWNLRQRKSSNTCGANGRCSPSWP